MSRRWGERFHHWGSTAEERARRYPCDDALPDHDQAYFRAVTIRATAAVVFRWLCQLREAPYSYDWIDNGGRRSPQRLTPGLDALAVGQPVMRIFDLVSYEPERHLTLALRHPGVFPPLAVSYAVVPEGRGCRLVVKLAVRFRPRPWDRLVRALLPPLDWIMMRRQLLNLKRLAESSRPDPHAADRQTPAAV